MRQISKRDFPLSDMARYASNTIMCMLVALYGTLVIAFMCQKAFSVSLWAILFAALSAVCLLISNIGKKPIFLLPQQPDRWNGHVFGGAFAVCFLAFLVYWFAYFPGGYSSDTNNQWMQIHGMLPLNDWHPALHTMLMGGIVALCDQLSFVVLVQGVFYAAAVGYMTATLWRWRISKLICVGNLLFLSLNPGFLNTLIFPWKDCAFAVSTLILATQLFSAHSTAGKWLKRPGNALLMGLSLCLCAILRHNGMALALAACAWLFVSFPKQLKNVGLCALCFLLLFVAIQGPVYSAAGVERKDKSLEEMCGLPLTVLAHIYVEAPEALDEETTQFLETLGPRETYVAHYRVGDWNSVKWELQTLADDSGYTLPQVFGYMIRASIAEPQLAMSAVGKLYEMSIWPVGRAYWRYSPYVDASGAQFGIVSRKHDVLSRGLNWLCRMSASAGLSWLFWKPGFYLLVIMLSCVLFAQRRPLSSLLMPAMLIAYHLATCVLLSSPTDFRFFLPTMMCAPIALAAITTMPQGD